MKLNFIPRNSKQLKWKMVKEIEPIFPFCEQQGCTHLNANLITRSSRITGISITQFHYDDHKDPNAQLFHSRADITI